MPISIPADILADCTLTRWNTLRPERREAVAEAIRMSLNREGYAFGAWRIENQGPEGEQPILLLTDTRIRLDFALIPGGTLLPGYDETQLAHLDKIYHLVEDWKADYYDAEEYDEEDEVGWEPDTPDQMGIFASESACDLRRKPPVEIAPFLIAVTPALAETPEMQQVVTLPEWWGETWEQMAADHDPIRLRWPMLEPVLHHYRWEVPTTWEWEWAVQGGKPGIFYWGDLLPKFVANPYEDEEEDERAEEMAAIASEALEETEDIINPPDDEMDFEEDFPAPLTEEQRRLLTDSVQFDDVMGLTFPPEKARVWPYANRFGLAGMLAWGDWCMPSDVPDDPHPLITRGGASSSYPWQGCSEWLSLLSASEGRQRVETDYADWKVLRPILRLGA